MKWTFLTKLSWCGDPCIRACSGATWHRDAGRYMGVAKGLVISGIERLWWRSWTNSALRSQWSVRLMTGRAGPSNRATGPKLVDVDEILSMNKVRQNLGRTHFTIQDNLHSKRTIDGWSFQRFPFFPKLLDEIMRALPMWKAIFRNLPLIGF